MSYRGEWVALPCVWRHLSCPSQPGGTTLPCFFSGPPSIVHEIFKCTSSPTWLEDLALPSLSISTLQRFRDLSSPLPRRTQLIKTTVSPHLSTLTCFTLGTHSRQSTTALSQLSLSLSHNHLYTYTTCLSTPCLNNKRTCTLCPSSRPLLDNTLPMEPAVPLAPPLCLTRTGPRSPTWPSAAESRTALLSATTVRANRNRSAPRQLDLPGLLTHA